jgi:ligand-binding sensor domain-containing protein
VWDGRSWSYPDPIPSPSGRKITSLAVDRRSGVWAGTRAGLAHWDRGKWTVLTEADGLAGNEIQCLLPDGDTLWVGTRTGLTHLPLRQPSEPRPSGSGTVAD